MNVMAEVSMNSEQSNLNRALTEFDEDALTVEPVTDSRATDTQTFEVRTSDEEVLTEFHEACTSHDIILDILRIHHEPDSTKRLVAAGGSENHQTR